MTTPPTGSNPCRRSQRWTAPLAQRCPPPRASTPASSTPTYPSITEPRAAGHPTWPLPQPTPPASSTPLPPASRPPSDPLDSPPQSCYRVLPWTATEHRPTADTHPFPDYHFIPTTPPLPQCNTHQSAEYEKLLMK